MPNLVTVVGRNTHILPHMLKHYEDKIDKSYVVVYRQSDDDKILEEIEELGITPYKVVTETKFHWEKVTQLYNEVKRTKPNDWWIVSDDDELQVYPESFDDIIKYCERVGYYFVTGGFLDRIGPDGTFPIVNKDTNLHEAFPYAGFFRYPMSGACPNKVTLMKGHVDVTPGQHYAIVPGGNSWGKSHRRRMPIQDVFAQVHHFKWDSSVLQRLMEVAAVRESYSFWKEYNKMHREIVKNDYKINLKNKKYLVEKLKNNSYIEYKDYPHWDKLTDLITDI
jgi:hypothetical protein